MNEYYRRKGKNIPGEDPKRTTIDEELFNSFLRKGDFDTAADYLSTFKFYDIKRQNKHLNDIEYLRDRAAQNRLRASKGLDTKTFDAINFKESLESNQPFIDMNDKSTNEYVNKYRELIKGFGSDDKNEADTIKFTFNHKKTGGEDNFIGWLGRQFGYYDDDLSVNTFAKGLGIELTSNENSLKEGLKSLGATYNPANGVDEIIINKSDPNFHKFLKAAYQAGLAKDDFTIKGYNGKKFIKEESTNFHSIVTGDIGDRQLYENIGKFKNLFDEVESKASIENQYDFTQDPNNQIITGSTIINAVDARDLQARTLLERGKLTPSQYQELKKNYEDEILGLLTQVNLEMYPDAYGMEFEEDDDTDITSRTMTTLNNDQRQRFQNALQKGIKDGRVRVNMMTSGDKAGTVISITPEGVSSKSPFYSANQKKTMQIFIPDLIEGDAETAFRSDEKYMAQKEVARMNMYKMQKDLVDGKYIKDVNNNGGYLYNADGTIAVDDNHPDGLRSTAEIQEIVRKNNKLQQLNDYFVDDLNQDYFSGNINFDDFKIALNNLIIVTGNTIQSEYGNTKTDEEKEALIENYISSILRLNNFGENKSKFLNYYKSLITNTKK